MQRISGADSAQAIFVQSGNGAERGRHRRGAISSQDGRHACVTVVDADRTCCCDGRRTSVAPEETGRDIAASQAARRTKATAARHRDVSRRSPSRRCGYRGLEWRSGLWNHGRNADRRSPVRHPLASRFPDVPGPQASQQRFDTSPWFVIQNLRTTPRRSSFQQPRLQLSTYPAVTAPSRDKTVFTCASFR